MGYDIAADKGYYLKTREFTDAELRLMIDGIFSSGAITDKEAHQLAKKLEGFSNKYFKAHVAQELSVDVGAIEKITGMSYDDIQADAIRKAATAKVMVLTGGPGTGKTTTTHGIISAYKAYGLKILLAAPTGRASKRMTEATGMEAKTIPC